MIDSNLDNNLKRIQKDYGGSKDIVIRKLKIKGKNIAYLFLESVSSDDKISNFTMKSINLDIKRTSYFNSLFSSLENNLVNSKVSKVSSFKELYPKLASGYTAIIVDGYNEFITIETKGNLDRSISPSTTEQIVRGPKDSFNENHMTNLGLIRKRIKDENLWFIDYSIGRRTKTKVTLAYINGVAIESRVETLKNKLNEIDVDGILDSGQIREFIIKDDKSAFPKIVSTERPDLVSSSLLEGKIAIFVENSPFVLVIPGVLVDFLHSPEDYYQNSYNATFSRFVRAIGFILTILTPGLYIAITTFNQEIIPDKLLISLSVQRSTVPFPSSVEILLLLITFEMLRESDIRTPSVMGTAISIVGALVLGDAAVAAGIVSPIAVIIVAITSISGLLFSDIDVVNGIRWYRVLFIIFSSTVGLIGFLVALIIFITKLSSISTFGVPYLTPFSPFNIIGQKDALLKFNKKNIKKRPKYLSNNTYKVGDIK